jgi:glycosyltransferase involved in cell wall biosynthesis
LPNAATAQTSLLNGLSPSMPRRLLFLTDVTPLPLDRGQRVRVGTLLEACAEVFRVTLIAPPPATGAERAEVESRHERVLWIRDSRSGGADRHLANWVGAARVAPGMRRQGTLRMYLPYVAALRSLDLRRFDVIWAERPHMARLVGPQRARTVLDLDDIEHLRIARAVAAQGGWRPSPAMAGELYRYLLYRDMELSWARGFRAAVVCSEEDRAYLEARGLGNVLVVPNGVSAALPERLDLDSARAATGPLRIAFLGNLGHPPNQDAIAWFDAEILPLLRAAHPDTVLDVLGPSADDALRARYQGRVRFLGFVPDLPSALSGYDVFVAPIRYGSGTRVKLLDAMACRIPVVTTAVGAEGLPVRDGEHLRLGETPAAFAGAVLELKRDPARGRALATAAQALVEARFRGPAIRARLAGWLRALPPGPEARAR